MKKICIHEADIQKAYAKLLEECHYLVAHNRMVAEGVWGQCEDFCFWYYDQQELLNKQIYIWASSELYQRSQKIAKALGMHVNQYNPLSPPEEMTYDILLCHFNETHEL